MADPYIRVGSPLRLDVRRRRPIARAIIRRSPVVVLDEATARMDPLTERRVVAAADRLLAGRTGIVVAHRLATVRAA